MVTLPINRSLRIDLIASNMKKQDSMRVLLIVSVLCSKVSVIRSRHLKSRSATATGPPLIPLEKYAIITAKSSVVDIHLSTSSISASTDPLFSEICKNLIDILM